MRPSSDSVDRLPTNREKWIGIAASILGAAICFPAAVLMILTPAGRDESFPTTWMVGLFFLALGAISAFVLYRTVFTKPELPSRFSVRLFAWIAVAITGALVIAAFLHPEHGGSRALTLGLFVMAAAYLAQSYKRGSHLLRRSGEKNK